MLLKIQQLVLRPWKLFIIHVSTTQVGNTVDHSGRAT
jgi:hypothetical protein